MREFPSLDEMVLELVPEKVAELRHKAIVTVLTARLRPGAQAVVAALGPIQDEAKLDELLKLTVLCPDLETFRAQHPPRDGNG